MALVRFMFADEEHGVARMSLILDDLPELTRRQRAVVHHCMQELVNVMVHEPQHFEERHRAAVHALPSGAGELDELALEPFMDLEADLADLGRGRRSST